MSLRIRNLLILVLVATSAWAQKPEMKFDADGCLVDPSGKRITRPDKDCIKQADVGAKEGEGEKDNTNTNKNTNTTVDKNDPFLKCQFEAKEAAVDEILAKDLLDKIKANATKMKAAKAADQTTCTNKGIEIGNLINSLIGKKDNNKTAPGGNEPGPGGNQPGSMNGGPTPTSGGPTPKTVGNMGGNTDGGGSDCAQDPAQCLTRFQDILNGIDKCTMEGGVGNAIVGLATKLSTFLGPSGSMVALGLGTLKSIISLFKNQKTDGQVTAELLDKGAKERVSANLDANLACLANKSYYTSVCAPHMLEDVSVSAPSPKDFEVACPEGMPKKKIEKLDKNSILPLYDCVVAARQIGQAFKNQEAKDRAINQCFACITTAPSEGNPKGIITTDAIDEIGSEVSENAAAYASVNETELPDLLDFARDYHAKKLFGEGRGEGLFDKIKAAAEAAAQNKSSVPRMQAEKKLMLFHCQASLLTNYTNPSKTKKTVFGKILSGGKRFKDIKGASVESIRQEPFNANLAKACDDLNSCLRPQTSGQASYYSSMDYDMPKLSDLERTNAVCDSLYQVEKKGVAYESATKMERRLYERSYRAGSRCENNTGTGGGLTGGATSKQ